ncbi:MAG: alpha/beta hydrolase [Bacteroidota bacterium]
MKKTTLLFFALAMLSSLAFAQENELEEHIDLSYYQGNGIPDSNHKFNLILPKESQAAPLLIWIGGGAWSYVDRHIEMDLGRRIAAEGIAFASIGHRLSSAVWRDPKLNSGIQHPAHVEDLAMAIKWLYEHADTYHYDKDKIIVGGFSSGAHLSSLVAMDSKYLAKWGLSPEIIKGIIPISGTYDIVDYHRVFAEGENKHLAKEHVEAVFGSTKESWIEASPITYMDGLKMPLLLIADANIGKYTRIFEREIQEAGVEEVEIVYADEFGHGDLWVNMAREDESTYRDKLVDFVRKWTLKDG